MKKILSILLLLFLVLPLWGEDDSEKFDGFLLEAIRREREDLVGRWFYDWLYMDGSSHREPIQSANK